MPLWLPLDRGLRLHLCSHPNLYLRVFCLQRDWRIFKTVEELLRVSYFRSAEEYPDTVTRLYSQNPYFRFSADQGPIILSEFGLPIIG